MWRRHKNTVRDEPGPTQTPDTTVGITIDFPITTRSLRPSDELLLRPGSSSCYGFPMNRVTFLAATLLPTLALSGGGPLNVLVLYNAEDSESQAIAEHYRAARSIPPQQLCGVEGLPAGIETLDFAVYDSLVAATLDTCLAALSEPDNIDYLVISRGLPLRVQLPSNGFYTSFAAMLQIHGATQLATGAPLAGLAHPETAGTPSPWLRNPEYLRHFGSTEAFTLENPHSGWYTAAVRIVSSPSLPPSFRRSEAGSESGYQFANHLWIVTHLDGFGMQDALALVDRALASDGTYPAAKILCMEGAQTARGARDPECEYVTRPLTLLGMNSTYHSPHDSSLSGETLAAYFTGAIELQNAIEGNSFVPGALACNLTSLGAVPQNFHCKAEDKCPPQEAQTSIARLVRAGATGVHGTVAEPLNSCFPNAGSLLLYVSEYNLGESFFFNQPFLYWQNLYLGDPLASPYAMRPTVTITEQPMEDTLHIQAEHARGIARLQIYFDGVQVAESEGGPLTLPSPEALVSRVLAVATASNGWVDRPGWAVHQQYVQANVQGWSERRLNTAPAPRDPELDSSPEASARPETDMQAPVVHRHTSDGCQASRVPDFGASPYILLLWFTCFAVRKQKASRCSAVHRMKD